MQKAKAIISKFINKCPEEIAHNTAIDKRAVQGSVLIHRMFAALAKEGYHVSDIAQIKTFGDFEHEVTEKAIFSDAVSISGTTSSKISDSEDFNLLNHYGNCDIGVDIEDIENMPVVDDFREEPFYLENFSQREISYCILQINPRASFAGKFAAKEALIKAKKCLSHTSLKSIEILNDDSGRPVYPGFSISIAHSTSLAIAIAVKDEPLSFDMKPMFMEKSGRDLIHTEKRENVLLGMSSLFYVCILSLVLSLCSITAVIVFLLK